MDPRQNALHGDVYRQGYLHKKKSVAKSLKKRWFTLDKDAFVAFKSETEASDTAECLEVMPLVDVQTVKKQHTSSHKHYPFEIITQQKTHVFLTDSAYEQDQWVRAFHEAMKFRCFNAANSDVTNKYANGTKERRRSSTGAKKLSQIKKYVDGFRPSIQRKSSGVDCDPNDTEYQGIPIGTMDIGSENDDVFITQKPPSPPPPASSSKTTSPPTVPSIVVNGQGLTSNRGQSRASDDSGQGPHDVRNVDSNSSTNSAATVARGEDSNGVDGDRSERSPAPTMSPPPVPAPAVLAKPKKQKYVDDETIYDEPPPIDDIYDVPPREIFPEEIKEVDDEEEKEQEQEREEEEEDEDDDDEEDDEDLRDYGEHGGAYEEKYPQPLLIKSSAMTDLQKILDEDSEEDEMDEEVASNSEDGTLSEYDNGHEIEEGDSLEVALTEKGVEKSAVDQLKDLLDSFDEL